MVGRSGAHGLVVRVNCTVFATGISNKRLQDSLLLSDGIVLKKDMLDAPEAACSEGRNLYLVFY